LNTYVSKPFVNAPPPPPPPNRKQGLLAALQRLRNQGVGKMIKNTNGYKSKE
jgi:hypothetical protein